MLNEQERKCLIKPNLAFIEDLLLPKTNINSVSRSQKSLCDILSSMIWMAPNSGLTTFENFSHEKNPVKCQLRSTKRNATKKPKVNRWKVH
jgi:hypothetical protein